MVYDSIKEVSVVTDDNQTSSKVLQIFLKYIQCDDIQIVGRLVKDEKIGVLHQNGEQIKPSFLAARQS